MKSISIKSLIETGILFCISFTLSGCNKNIIEIENKLQIGVFGGSVSSNIESEAAKNIWRANLDANIVTCGVGGAGFSSLTNNCVPAQIRNAPVFDVYILWASTNDVEKSTVGDLDHEDESTQDGGIVKAISMIRNKNSKAQILFFTSLPRFDNDRYNQKIPDFVNDQIAICERENIPFLDQFRLCGFYKSNCDSFYTFDRMHLNREGYKKIAYMQMEFIRENTKNYKK